MPRATKLSPEKRIDSKGMTVWQKLQNSKYIKPEAILKRVTWELQRYRGATMRRIEADDLAWLIDMAEARVDDLKGKAGKSK